MPVSVRCVVLLAAIIGLQGCLGERYCTTTWPNGEIECNPGCYLLPGGQACAPCSGACLRCGPGAPVPCLECAARLSQIDPGVSGDVPVYLDVDTRACTKCSAHPLSSGCAACDGAGRCSRCSPGWALLRNGTRARCQGGPQCRACKADTLACSFCADGYGLTATGACTKCRDPNCQRCPAFDRCARCVSVPENSYRPPFGLDARTGTCRPCPAKCLLCRGSDGVCQQCAYGFGRNASGGCSACQDASCLSCPDSPATCTQCALGAVLLPNGTCGACGHNCAGCRRPGECLECLDLSLIGGSCLRCPDPRCADCSGSDVRVCKRCRKKDRFFDRQSGRCRLRRPAGAVAGDQTPPAAPGGGGGGKRSLRALESSSSSSGGSDGGVQGSIVNGGNATKGRYPWLASLQQLYRGKYRHSCGGTLVHERVVLTAAHCLVEEISGAWREEAAVFPQVRIGGYNLSARDYTARQAVWPLVLEGYFAGPAGGNYDSDVALLLLDRPVRGPVVRLAEAPPLTAPLPGSATAVGWGVLRSGSTKPSTLLQQVVLDLLPLPACQKAYAGPLGNLSWQDSTMMCAGDPRKRQATCQGDSGGPLAVLGSGPERDVQIGIVSFGIGCGDRGFPDVFTDVAKVRRWVDAGIRYLLQNADSLSKP